MITALVNEPLGIIRAWRALYLIFGTERFLPVGTGNPIYIHLVFIAAAERLELQFVEVFHFIFHLDVHKAYLLVTGLLPFIELTTFLVLAWFLVPPPFDQHILFLFLFVALLDDLIARTVSFILKAIHTLLLFSRIPRLVLIYSQRDSILFDLLRRVNFRQLTYSSSKVKLSLLAFSTLRRYV